MRLVSHRVFCITLILSSAFVLSLKNFRIIEYLNVSRPATPLIDEVIPQDNQEKFLSNLTVDSTKEKLGEIQVELEAIMEKIQEVEANANSGMLSGSLQPLQPIYDSIHGFRSSGDNQGVQQKYFLSAMVFNRIFPEDSMEFTIYEIWQWLEFHLYAGVEHFYWYDCGKNEDEYQELGLLPYIRSGQLSYHKFQDMFPSHQNDIHFEQDNSEKHFLRNHGNETKWVLVCDVDEYVTMHLDTNPLFLSRFLKFMERQKAIVGDSHWVGTGEFVAMISIPNVFFEGSPALPLPALLIERFQLRTMEEEDSQSQRLRSKCIILTSQWSHIQARNPHALIPSTGQTYLVPPSKMRLNHYWGFRALNRSAPSSVPDGYSFVQWGDKVMTRDETMQPMVKIVKVKLKDRVSQLTESLYLTDLHQLKLSMLKALKSLEDQSKMLLT